MGNPERWERIPSCPSWDQTCTSLLPFLPELRGAAPATLPKWALRRARGEGRVSQGRRGQRPTRDSSRSRRRYLLSMAWVRFSSCVDTVSNSSSTAEE